MAGYQHCVVHHATNDSKLKCTREMKRYVIPRSQTKHTAFQWNPDHVQSQETRGLTHLQHLEMLLTSLKTQHYVIHQCGRIYSVDRRDSFVESVVCEPLVHIGRSRMSTRFLCISILTDLVCLLIVFNMLQLF